MDVPRNLRWTCTPICAGQIVDPWTTRLIFFVQPASREPPWNAGGLGAASDQDARMRRGVWEAATAGKAPRRALGDGSSLECEGSEQRSPEPPGLMGGRGAAAPWRSEPPRPAVVLPCVPATAILDFNLINSASISARRTTGKPLDRAATSSGFPIFMADETTTTSAVSKFLAA